MDTPIFDTSLLSCHDPRMDAVADIKARLDVVELVGEYVQLKPAGAGSFKGVCPFHQERTPSFHVSRTRQSWHCFGCDTGGDSFTFIEKIEGMEFREALTFLAQKAGVTLPEAPVFEKTTSKKKRLFEVNEMAAKFFRSVLLNASSAQEARAYVVRRQIDDLSADLFLIGYAPDTWSSLTEALGKRGVLADELVAAGLAMKRDQGDGVYDRFRGRLLFPIADVHGNIVGFTGRILTSDPNQPKYMNTPETSVYKKSMLLYGLDKAKAEIRKTTLAVIVEGNMDVVSSHQAGITNVVAASGTALTLEQLTLLKRFTTNLAIAFDQDAAGGAATLRGLDLARQQDFSIKIITLPPDAGKDPDEACKKDPALWKQAIASATSIMDWVYARAFARHPEGSPESKRAIADEVLPELARIMHPVERDAWTKRLAQDLGVSETAFVRRAGAAPSLREPSRKQAASSRSDTPLEERRAWLWFATYLVHEQDIEKLLLQETLLRGLEDEPLLQALYSALQAAYRERGFSSSILGEEERKTFTTLALLAERAFVALDRTHLEQEREALARLLRQHTNVRLRARLLEDMRLAEAAHDTSRIEALSKHLSTLT